MTYTPFHVDWRDDPDHSTPIPAAFLEQVESALVGQDTRITTLESASFTLASADGSNTAWKLIVMPDGSLKPVPRSVNAPAAPTGLTATPHLSFVGLTWNAPSGAVSYQLYRGGILLASPTIPSWNDAAGITVGSTYAYYVIALNAYGMWSPASATVNTTVSSSLNATPVFESITVWPANPTPSDTVYVHVNLPRTQHLPLRRGRLHD